MEVWKNKRSRAISVIQRNLDFILLARKATKEFKRKQNISRILSFEIRQI